MTGTCISLTSPITSTPTCVSVAVTARARQAPAETDFGTNGVLVGAYFNWLLVAGRLRSMSEKLKAVTLPTFISNRFDDRSGVIKVVSTLVILFFFTLYVASGLKGGTLLFAHTFGATESWSLIITTVVVVSYTFLGGYRAVC